MPDFDTVLKYILGAFFVIIVFALGYAYLKPHRIHKKYPVSTLLLKVSYLLYLMVILIVIYLASFKKDGGLGAVFMDVEFFAFLVVLFVPTIGVFARKLGHFRKQRESFYYFFTIINVLSIAALLVMYFI